MATGQPNQLLRKEEWRRRGGDGSWPHDRDVGEGGGGEDGDGGGRGGGVMKAASQQGTGTAGRGTQEDERAGQDVCVDMAHVCVVRARDTKRANFTATAAAAAYGWLPHINQGP